MPIPIRPVHDLDTIRAFDTPAEVDESTLSALQLQVLGGERTAGKLSEQVLAMLVEIDKHEDEVVTAASKAALRSKAERYMRVPKTISDHDLLRLKTEQLVIGQGRTVKFTDRARTALRDHYLNKSNSVKETRTKQKFEYASSEGRVATASVQPGKFVRVAHEEPVIAENKRIACDKEGEHMVLDGDVLRCPKCGNTKDASEHIYDLI